MAIKAIEITDIASHNQLLSYALAGQLERLRKQRGDLSHRRVAEAAPLGNTASNAASVLSHALRDGPSPEQLRKLDQVIGALSSDTDGIGGLHSLCSRVSGDKYGHAPVANVPPNWTAGLLKESPVSEFEVLAQASALLSAFMAAERMDTRSVAALRASYTREIDPLVRRLILMSVGPPTCESYDAQMMLGSLASYAFELTKDRLESKMRYSPLAFRLWRSITRQVRLRRDAEHARDLMVWVRQLLLDSRDLRMRNIYPGAGLDLELALAVPPAWSPHGNDWVDDILRNRALDRYATIRERGTAAMGLWQRAVEQHRDLTEARESLRDLMAEFKDPECRPDAPAGIQWVATTLEHCIETQRPVCNEWPDVGDPWFRSVRMAAAELDNFGVPEHLLDATKNLFLHMILQNAGAYRRNAIETAVSSGVTTPVARALGLLLRTEQEEAWLRIRAESALGYLQKRNPWVEADLTQACLSAYQSLDLPDYPAKWVPRARITELHTALFAVGDCFGVPSAEERAKTARERLLPILTELAEPKSDRAQVLRRPARAAAYVLIVTAQPRKKGKPDISEVLLEKMTNHPDEVTARLSRWAMRFRFDDGAVRPMLDAVASRADDDIPY